MGPFSKVDARPSPIDVPQCARRRARQGATTQGVDVTARYRADLDYAGTLVVTLAANFNRTRFDRIAGTLAALSALGISTSLFDLTNQVRLTQSTPKDKERRAVRTYMVGGERVVLDEDLAALFGGNAAPE